MAKKIAAPHKAARAKSPRKASKAKAVGAPATYKPKGSPKEKLAYLNKGEMAALVKRKGSPARRGPKGLPSFADDSASSKGVSRGDSSGTKGSSSGNKSGVGGGGGGGGGSSGTRGSSTGPVGSKSGSNAPGNSGGGSGGQGGYNSGMSGSRYGGASTQAPGMGRNEGRVGPRSPMGGQGTSFATPKAARDDTLRRAYGIEDQRGLQNMPQRPYIDKYGPVNPNLPQRDPFDFKRARDINAERDAEARRIGDFDLDDYRNPQEIRANAERIREYMDEEDARYDAAWRGLRRSAPLGNGEFRANVGRSAASGRLPDIKLGGPREGTLGGYSGGGMGGTHRGGGWGDKAYNNGLGGSGWKAGGLVKSKTFKKK